MLTLVPCSSTGWRLLSATTLLGALLATVPATAEIVIDDFVDDLRIDLPEDNLDRFLSSSIGDLASTRVMSAGGIQTRPVGFLDVNQSLHSALTVSMPTTMHTGSTPAAWTQLEYALTASFGGVDLTDRGANNAVILDVERLSAEIPLSRIYVLATRNRQIGGINSSSSYISTYSPIPQSLTSSSLIFPFDSFQLARGTPIPDFDFSFIRELDVLVELALFDPNLPEQLSFEMVLTEIRVGREVSEPSTIVYIGLLSMLLWIVPRNALAFPRIVLKGVVPCGNEFNVQRP